MSPPSPSAPASPFRSSAGNASGLSGAASNATPSRLKKVTVNDPGTRTGTGGASAEQSPSAGSAGSSILVKNRTAGTPSKSGAIPASVSGSRRGSNVQAGEWLASVRQDGHVRRTSQSGTGEVDETTPRKSGTGKINGYRPGQGVVSRDRSGRGRTGAGAGANGDARGNKGGEKKKGDGRMGLWRMMALTVSMGGSQIAWTVELGYGNPYLLSLGLSRQLTSLVWLAGPISGLIAQPLIGAISDSSNSKYRRRYWIVTATMLLVFSGLGLAFTPPIAEALVDLAGGGEGDWDPRRAELVKNTAIALAILSFYCLDFALNALQASLRNLVLDVTPSEQLASANAWHGRFNHVGNIVGFTLGFLNLADVPIIRLVGGGQFRKVCIVAMAILCLTVWLTCWTQEEEERESPFGERRSKLRDIFGTIYSAVLHLPKPVRRVCIVQIAAFMGWFPYLFYSTTYVAEVMAQEIGAEPDPDVATRAGSLALLIYSFVAIIAGTLLPYLAARDRRLLRPDKQLAGKAKKGSAGKPRLLGRIAGAGAGAGRSGGDETDDERSEDDVDSEEEARHVEMERIREMVREWKLEAARQGRPLKLPTMPFMLRNIWTAGLLLFAAVMMSTFFIKTVWQATVAIGVVGICWAIACWVPFAIIMEFLKEMDDTKTTSDSALRRGARPGGASSSAYGGTGSSEHHTSAGFRPLHTRAASTPMGKPLPRLGAYSQPTSPVYRYGHPADDEHDNAHDHEEVGEHDVSSGAARSDSPHARLEIAGQAVRPGSKASSRSRERGRGADERSRLLQRSYSTADLEGQHGESMAYTGPGKVAGGTVMGIHNLAIVFPQFIIAGVAYVIFKIFDGDAATAASTAFDTAEVLFAVGGPGSGSGSGAGTPGSPGSTPPGGPRSPKNGVAWIMRFGGLMALIGALISRKVPPTKTEKAMRRRLAEMREESEE